MAYLYLKDCNGNNIWTLLVNITLHLFNILFCWQNMCLFGEEKMKQICTACSGSGIYIDYAGPDIVGGIVVNCSVCNGTGYTERK